MNMMEDVNVKLMYQGRVRTFRKSELRPLREEAMTEMQQLVMELMDDRAGKVRTKSLLRGVELREYGKHADDKGNKTTTTKPDGKPAGVEEGGN